MFHELLRRRLLDMGMPEEKLPSQFRALLARHGVDVSLQCTCNWLDGSRAPSRGNLAGVLDALGAWGDHRSAMLAAWSGNGSVPTPNRQPAAEESL